MITLRSVCAGVLLSGLVGCHPGFVRDTVDDPEAGSLVRFLGPVRLSLTALLVAPGKDSGLPWDGPGRLPGDLAEHLKARPARSALGALFRGLTAGTPTMVVARLLPWAADAFISGMAAPDVQAVVSLNGKTLARATKVQNSYFPTWATVYSDATMIGDFDQIEVRATDADALFDDHIGVCTSQGMPYVDQAGYASARTFTCLGQLWAVALRVVPVSSQ